MSPDPSGATSLDPSAVRDTHGKPAATWSWTYVQGVLDDALEAVHAARVRGEELSNSLREQRRAAAELEGRCEELQARYEQTRDDAESTQGMLEQIKSEHDRLLGDYLNAQISVHSLEDVLKHSRRLEQKLRLIAEALERNDRRTQEIREHYAQQLDASERISEEINFARDEAVAEIRRAMRGVQLRRIAQPRVLWPLD
jgi:chromosome segregation ATPase